MEGTVSRQPGDPHFDVRAPRRLFEEVVEDADDGKVKLRCYHTSEALDLN